MVLVHLTNVCLLYRLVGLTTDSARLASFGAALWGTSAFTESTLGWYAVVGQVIAVTALLLILCQAQRLAVEGRAPDRRTQWAWYALALAGATSFGTGTVTALLLPFVLGMLLPRWRSSWHPPLVSLLMVAPVLYVATNRLYTHLTGVESLPIIPWTRLFSYLIPLELVSLRLACISLASLLLGFWFRFLVAMPSSWYAIAALFAAGVILAARGTASVRRQARLLRVAGARLLQRHRHCTRVHDRSPAAGDRNVRTLALHEPGSPHGDALHRARRRAGDRAPEGRPRRRTRARARRSTAC